MGFWRCLAIEAAQRVNGLRILNPDISDEDWAIIRAVRPYTMTSTARIAALIDAVRYVDRAGVPGALVECGVWRGGSLMTMAMAHEGTRDVWGYDTFAGMPPAGEHDTTRVGWQRRRVWPWLVVNYAEVYGRLVETTPHRRLHVHAGDVATTIRQAHPEQIAVLRLDTDWYESTRVELEVLWPLVSPGGVLIIDDYGHWDGARRAVDEFFAGQAVLLQRIDYTGRMVSKPMQATTGPRTRC